MDRSTELFSMTPAPDPAALALADELERAWLRECRPGRDPAPKPIGHDEWALIVAALRGSAPATVPGVEEIRGVATAICKSRACEGISCCRWPAQGGRASCPVAKGLYDDAARAAIAALTRPSAPPDQESSGPEKYRSGYEGVQAAGGYRAILGAVPREETPTRGGDDALISLLAERAAAYRFDGPSAEHTAKLFDQAADALAARDRELAEKDAEIEWLRRTIQWCSKRLRKEAYLDALDARLAAGPTQPDHTPITAAAIPDPTQEPKPALASQSQERGDVG